MALNRGRAEQTGRQEGGNYFVKKEALLCVTVKLKRVARMRHNISLKIKKHGQVSTLQASVNPT